MPLSRNGLATSAVVLYLLQTAATYWEVKDMVEKCPAAGLPPTTPDLNPEWLQSITTWYYAYQSTSELYATAAQILKVRIDEVDEADLYYDACILYHWGLDVFEALGKVEKFQFFPNGDGSLAFEMSHLGLKGNGTMPVTDNKSWVFFVACYHDGSGGWGIIHTKPTLEKKVLNELLDYAKSLGFNRKHFTHIRYDHCKFIVNTAVPPGFPTPKAKYKPKAEKKAPTKNEL